MNEFLSAAAAPFLLWLLCYLVGSVSFGYLLARASGYGDIRAHGSKGTGATNVLRIAGRKMAALALLGDMLKGFLPILAVAHFWGESHALLAASGILLGHLFPLWLGFRGGKGIASLIGITLALEWRMAVIFCVCWLLVALLTRYSSLSSLLATATLPASAAWLHPHWLPATLCAFALTSCAHRRNIRRLWRREEPRIGRKEASS